MSNRLHRRTVLRAGSAVLASTIGGCTGLEGSKPERNATDASPTPSPPDRVAVETPAPGRCEATDLPDPEPTDEGLVSKSYPDLPDPLTSVTATGFARGFEIAYSYNQFLDRFTESGYEDVSVTGGVPEWAVYDRANGYIVGATVEVTFSDTDTPTPPRTSAPSGTIPSAAWYYVTDRFALRNDHSSGDLRRGEEPTLEGARTVRCLHPSETAE